MGFEIRTLFSFFFHWSGGIMFLSSGHSIHQGSWQRDSRSTKLPVKFQGMHLASSFIPHDFLKRFMLLVLQSNIWIFYFNSESVAVGVFTLILKSSNDCGRPTADCCYCANIVLTAHMTSHTAYLDAFLMAEGSTVQSRRDSVCIHENRWQVLSVNSIYIADGESDWSRLCGRGRQEYTLTCLTTSSVLLWP